VPRSGPRRRFGDHLPDLCDRISGDGEPAANAGLEKLRCTRVDKDRHSQSLCSTLFSISWAARSRCNEITDVVVSSGHSCPAGTVSALSTPSGHLIAISRQQPFSYLHRLDNQQSYTILIARVGRGAGRYAANLICSWSHM
jgi:hypothetical protein